MDKFVITKWTAAEAQKQLSCSEEKASEDLVLPACNTLNTPKLKYTVHRIKYQSITFTTTPQKKSKKKKKKAPVYR